MDSLAPHGEGHSGGQPYRASGRAARPQKLYIRIPGNIWNSVPWPQASSTTTSPPRISHKRRRSLSSASDPNSDTSFPYPPTSPSQHRHLRPKKRRTEYEYSREAGPRRPPSPPRCGIKISRFQYGGPEHRQKGNQANTVTLNQPCGRGTCADCVRWNGHLLRNRDDVGVSAAIPGSHSRLKDHGAASPLASAPTIVSESTTDWPSSRGTRQNISCTSYPGAYSQGLSKSSLSDSVVLQPNDTMTQPSPMPSRGISASASETEETRNEEWPLKRKVRARHRVKLVIKKEEHRAVLRALKLCG